MCVARTPVRRFELVSSIRSPFVTRETISARGWLSTTRGSPWNGAPEDSKAGFVGESKMPPESHQRGWARVATEERVAATTSRQNSETRVSAVSVGLW